MIKFHPTDPATRSDIWLTPPDLLAKLGEFDLDPCAPIARPWNTAKNHYTELEDGLLFPWFGRVWMNPPYSQLKEWMNKMALHGKGTALTFTRTETVAFQQYVFPVAHSILFIKGRVYFYDINGNQARNNSGCASCLIAYGEKDSEILSGSKILGRHILLK